MASEKNQYGLSRDIPDGIARLIRQKSGFGCIFCGKWIYQYEHILPEFKDAKEHDPNKIALLCANHHQKVTTGRLSKYKVENQYKNPIVFQTGYANDFLELNEKIGIVFGRVFIPEPNGPILMVDDIPIISFQQPSEFEPMKLSAKFYDDNEQLVMEIINDEQRGYINNWDIQQIGKRTIIRRKRGEIVLQLLISSENVLQIEKLNMKINGKSIIADSSNGTLYIRAGNNGATLNFYESQVITNAIKINGGEIQIISGSSSGTRISINEPQLDYQNYMENLLTQEH